MIGFEIEGLEYRVFNHSYAISRCGKVLRKFVLCIPVCRKDGYMRVGRFLVHRMIAQCWMDGFDPKKQVHHINGIRNDNRLENLECISQRDHLTERHAEQMSENGRYTRTQETREKIRQSRLGKVTSEETKAKQRAALLGKKRPYFSRAKHSEESKQNRSLSHVRNLACRINGVEYRSFAAASLATGIHRFTIRKRCLSKNFPNYEIIG